MENCLKTQLKVEVDNNNLIKMDEIIATVSVTSSTHSARRKIIIGNGFEAFSVICPEGNYLSLNSNFSNPTNQLDFTANSNPYYVYLLEGDYHVRISGKNKMKILEFPDGGNISTASPITNLDIRSLKYNTEKLIRVNFRGCALIGDISFLNDNIVNAYFWDNGNNFTGNIETLGRCKNLTEFDARSRLLEGEVKTMLNGMVSAGRTSGQLVLDARRGVITYNGTIPNTKFTIKFGSSMENPTTEETNQGWQKIDM